MGTLPFSTSSQAAGHCANTHTHRQLHGSNMALHRTALGVQKGCCAQEFSSSPYLFAQNTYTQEQPQFFICSFNQTKQNKSIMGIQKQKNRARRRSKSSQLGGAGKEGITRSLEQEASRHQPANQVKQQLIYLGAGAR